MRILRRVMLVAVLASVACDKKAADDTPPDQAGDSRTSGQMVMPGVPMIPAMRAHLDSMATMSPLELAGAMTAHQDLASRTMDAMGADMRAMGMQPDSAWAALSDSLRLDLAEMSGLSGAQLKARMDAHAERLRRIMTRHEGMMKM